MRKHRAVQRRAKPLEHRGAAAVVHSKYSSIGSELPVLEAVGSMRDSFLVTPTRGELEPVSQLDPSHSRGGSIPGSVPTY